MTVSTAVCCANGRFVYKAQRASTADVVRNRRPHLLRGIPRTICDQPHTLGRCAGGKFTYPFLGFAPKTQRVSVEYNPTWLASKTLRVWNRRIPQLWARARGRMKNGRSVTGTIVEIAFVVTVGTAVCPANGRFLFPTPTRRG